MDASLLDEDADRLQSGPKSREWACGRTPYPSAARPERSAGQAAEALVDRSIDLFAGPSPDSMPRLGLPALEQLVWVATSMEHRQDDNVVAFDFEVYAVGERCRDCAPEAVRTSEPSRVLGDLFKHLVDGIQEPFAKPG